MKILAVDTSANVAAVALAKDGVLLGECMINNKKTHSEKLMPMIDTLLKDNGVDITEIDLFAVANGPGSFTGLRIGVSTVKGLAHAVNKPIVGISTLEGLAYNLFETDGIICPIMDARRSQVYNAVYKWENGEFKELIAPRAISLDECLDGLKDEIKVYFLGDGVPVYEEEIKKNMVERAIFAKANNLNQRASSLAVLAEKRADKAEDYNSFMPFYLRKPQAEREYEEKIKKGDL